MSAMILITHTAWSISSVLRESFGPIFSWYDWIIRSFILFCSFSAITSSTSTTTPIYSKLQLHFPLSVILETHMSLMYHLIIDFSWHIVNVDFLLNSPSSCIWLAEIDMLLHNLFATGSVCIQPLLVLAYQLYSFFLFSASFAICNVYLRLILIIKI